MKAKVSAAKDKELPKPQLTHAQHRYLADRIGVASRRAHYNYAPMPPKVRAAEKVLKQWQRQQNKLSSKFYAAQNVAERKAREALLFATPAQALAAVCAFERLR